MIFCSSCRKENYDLCHICYNEMGNGTEYIRMDRPASARFPRCVYEQSKNFVITFEHCYLLFSPYAESLHFHIFFYGAANITASYF